MTDKPLEGILFRILDLLDRVKIPYMVMGGLASRVIGLPRSTYDVDLTLVLDPEAVTGFCQEVERMGFSVPEAHQRGFVDTLKGMGKFTFQDLSADPPVAVDCFLVTTPYQREAFTRRIRMELDDRTVWMISPEDLVLHKLLAGRGKDFQDIDGIFLIQGTMDRAYLRKWAAVLGVSEMLEGKLPPEG